MDREFSHQRQTNYAAILAAPRRAIAVTIPPVHDEISDRTERLATIREYADEKRKGATPSEYADRKRKKTQKRGLAGGRLTQVSWMRNG